MNVNVLLFDAFETLDAFGPVEILGRVEGYTLRFLSLAGGLVRSAQGVAVATEPADAADPAGILLVPGGQGTRPLVDDAAFLERLRTLAASSAFCLTVCTGSALLAKTGLLDGRKATSNKRSFDWVKSQRGAVEWTGRARWVVDEKYYTSSGISAGMDMALGFVADRFGQEQADALAERIEYVRHADRNEDPFAR